MTDYEMIIIFLTILALLIAGAAALICHCSKKAFRELDKAMKELEEVCKDELES